jgi:hypothetical protein
MFVLNINLTEDITVPGHTRKKNGENFFGENKNVKKVQNYYNKFVVKTCFSAANLASDILW